MSLGEVGEAAVKLGGHAQAEHAVAEELETLVRVYAVGSPRRVREHLAQGRLVQLLCERQKSEGQGESMTTRGRLLPTGDIPPSSPARSVAARRRPAS